MAQLIKFSKNAVGAFCNNFSSRHSKKQHCKSSLLQSSCYQEKAVFLGMVRRSQDKCFILRKSQAKSGKDITYDVYQTCLQPRLKGFLYIKTYDKLASNNKKNKIHERALRIIQG